VNDRAITVSTRIVVAVAALVFVCAAAVFALGAIGDGLGDVGTCPAGEHVIRVPYFDLTTQANAIDSFCEDQSFDSFPLPSRVP
jgi:hypothetical protein